MAKSSAMKQNERAIIRKRTQQLVYLELGRNNGGVMLNLSEEGCGFQAISPVERGKTRFAFQISGGRRIAGEGEVEWTDGVGVTGGLRFIDLSAEARKQICMWLEETNAPEELGEASWASTRVTEAAAPAAPPAPPWSHIPIESLPILENERARFPLLREDGSFGAHARSVAVWRGIASVTTVAALAALIAVYQREVGNSMIWLGETLAGKTKASVVVPQDKPMGVPNPSPDVNGAAPAKAQEDAVPKGGASAEAKQAQEAPEVTRGEEQYPAKTDAVMRSAERPESLLEQQPVRERLERRIEGETVQSLWDAVQAGSVSAEMSLAERFARGEGVVKNCDQARVLLKAAANRGNRDARLKLYELESGGCRQ
jgi:hypothetical protein